MNIILFTLSTKASTPVKPLTAIEDATIILEQPANNNGGEVILQVGYYGNWLEAYIKFDLSKAPNNFQKAEIHLEFPYIEVPMWVYLYETSADWGGI